ncbi:MAG: hypothetical protein LBC38_00025, partial [Oscillospiraceae bacterium]|nr:hypothetical protein [Oscillospiraceae bacterium]
MKLSLALKTLFRTPLKTLVTFALLLAVTFMFVYNLTEYTLTKREFDRAVSTYRGVFSVENGAPEYSTFPLISRSEVNEEVSGYFLLSDPENKANYDDYFPYERFHQQDLPQTDIDAILELPYVTGSTMRYMTAGVSDAYRTFNRPNYYDPALRIVFEATLVGKNADQHLGKGWSYEDYLDLYIEDIKLLAGNPDWLDMSENESPDADIRVRLYMNSQKWVEENNYNGKLRTASPHTSVRPVGLMIKNLFEPKSHRELKIGQRYIFAARYDPFMEIEDEERQIYYPPNYFIGDETLYDWWPYFYPMDGLPENYLELDEFAPLRELIQITDDDLHTYDVVYTDDLSATRRIQENRAVIVEGRAITPEDAGSAVCVVSECAMTENGWKLGDKIKLKLGNRLFEQFMPVGAVASLRGRYASEWTEEQEFEIIGSYTDTWWGTRQEAWFISKMRTDDLWWAYSESTVFVPTSFLPVSGEKLAAHEFKPSEISFVVGDARNIQAFMDECIPTLEAMGFTVYFSDGGWLSIEKQIALSETLALAKLAAFGAATMLALGLVVYLFVVRKRKDYAIMRALGTSKHKSNRTLYVPLLLLGLCAALVGSAAAVIYSGIRVESTLKQFTEAGIAVDSSVPLIAPLAAIAGELVLMALMIALGLKMLSRLSILALLQDSS